MDETLVGLSPSNTVIILIDAQEFFWEHCHARNSSLEERIEQLLLLSTAMDIPVLATFEHPLERKGELTKKWQEAFPSHGKRVVKKSYNCCAEPAVPALLQAESIRNIAVAGSETDVCVLLSVLGLLGLGYNVHVIQDCVFSSSRNCDVAISRMVQAGAIPTTYKSFAYEICGSVEATPWLTESTGHSLSVPPGFVDPDDLATEDPLEL